MGSKLEDIKNSNDQDKDFWNSYLYSLERSPDWESRPTASGEYYEGTNQGYFYVQYKVEIEAKGQIKKTYSNLTILNDNIVFPT
jgi:hypothetical protein